MWWRNRIHLWWKQILGQIAMYSKEMALWWWSWLRFVFLQFFFYCLPSFTKIKLRKLINYYIFSILRFHPINLIYRVGEKQSVSNISFIISVAATKSSRLHTITIHLPISRWSWWKCNTSSLRYSTTMRRRYVHLREWPMHKQSKFTP